MKKLNFRLTMTLSGLIMIFMFTRCEKEAQPDQDFNLDVSLRGGKVLVILSSGRMMIQQKSLI
ncbi:MAG: hypothetical protein WKF97_11270 [Chitinophagaceae bacterium]